MNKILLTAAVIVATSFTLCAQNNKDMKTSKTLVAYFSATGTTAQVAKDIADLTGGTLYEIAPKAPTLQQTWTGTTSNPGALWK